MRKLNHALLAVATLAFASCNTQKEEINYQVIPLPQEVVVSQEPLFTLQETTKILYPEGNELLKRNAEFLSGYAQSGGAPAGEGTVGDGRAFAGRDIPASLPPRV